MARRPASDLSIGVVRHHRSALLRGTALQAATALVFATGASAQLSPTARPAGGQVVAGAASIGQTVAQTTVNQSTQRAAIDWRSFDVGSQHTVQFNQPNTSAVTLNRVTGPDPSQIAGRIVANGNVVLTNGAGVFFHQGAQVNANSLVVSAPGITNENFMAGRMVFDQPAKPGATVSNAGNITVKQAGLAALVAPNVVNSGTITAKLGRVVLAGAEAHTLDLYGDGLVSIDVTKAVRTLPTTPDGKPVTALVTNTGTVVADGGSVQITARAADGLIQTLVQAGGSISADTAAGKPGRIEIAGIGGSVRVEGNLSASGGAQAPGGSIAVNATDAVTIAARARIAADGGAGGGTVALGTTIARARAARNAALGASASPGVPSGTAATVVVEAGATVSASGRNSGAGGTVAALSTRSTKVAGTLAARGGPSGGNGGLVEASSARTLTVSGSLDTAAPSGKAGTAYLDPDTIYIDDYSCECSVTHISPATLAAIAQSNGRVSVVAGSELEVLSPVSIQNADLWLVSGGILHVWNNITVAGSGTNTLTLTAGGNLTVGPDAGGFTDATNPSAVYRFPAAIGLQSTGTMVLQSLTNTAFDTTQQINAVTLRDRSQLIAGGGLLIEAANRIDLGQRLQLQASGSYTVGGQTYSGIGVIAGNAITATKGGTPSTLDAASGGIFVFAGGAVDLEGVTLTTSGRITVAGGGIGVVNDGSSTVLAVKDLIALVQPFALTQDTLPSSLQGTLYVPPSSPGNITINGTVSADQINVATGSGGVTLAGSIAAGTLLNLYATGAIDSINASLTAPTLTGRAGTARLNGADNHVAQLGDFSLTGAAGADSLLLTSSDPLTVTGTVAATLGNIILDNSATRTADITVNGTIRAANGNLGLRAGHSVTAAVGSTLSAPSGSLLLEASFGATDPAADGAAHVDAPISGDQIIIGAGIGGIDLRAGVTGTTYVHLRGLGNLDQSLIDTIRGPIAQSAGIITTPELTARGTSVLLPSANQAATLGKSTATSGDFSLVNAGALQVTSDVTVSAGRSLSISGQSVDIGAGGSLSAPNGTVALAATGALSESGGIITAGTLTAAGASVQLTAGNRVTTLGTSTARTGDFALTDASLLQVGGGVTVSTGHTIALVSDGMQIVAGGSLTASGGTVALAPYTPSAQFQLSSVAGAAITAQTLSIGNASTTGAISLAGTLDLSNVTTLDLHTAGAATQSTSDSLRVGTVTGTVGSASLVGAANQIGTIGPFTVGAGDASAGQPAFKLVDNQTLTVAGLTASAGSATVTANGNLAITAAISVSGTLTLTALGAVTQSSAGAIAAGTLAGSAQSMQLATASSNAIGQLGRITVTGSATPYALTLANTVPLTLTGNLTATSGNVSITNSAAITQSAGVIATNGLAVSGASVRLESGNLVASLDASGATAGDFSLFNAQPLDVRGRVAVANGQTLTLLADTLTFAGTGALAAPGGTVALAPYTAGAPYSLASALTTAFTADTLRIGTPSTGNISLSGSFDLSNVQTLDVRSAGAVTQSSTSDVLKVGTLTGQSATAALIGANQIGTLGPYTVTGGGTALTLNNAQALAVAGLTATNGSASLTAAGALTLSGPVAVGQTLTLNVPGGTVTQASGSLAAGTLTGTAGAMDLTGANQIARLGPITVADRFVLTNQTDLALAGNLSVTGTGGYATLTLAGALSQPGGIIAADRLGASGSSVDLSGANRVSVLTASGATTGAFTFADSQGLTVAGRVAVANGQTLTLLADTLTFAGTGALAAPGGTVALAPYTAGAPYSLASALTTAFTADTLRIGTPSTGNISLSGSFDLSNVQTLDVRSAGAVTQSSTSDVLKVGTLTGQSATAALIGANQIGTLGPYTVTGGGTALTLNNAQALAVAGLTATNGSASLTAAGPLAIGGTVTVGGTLTLGAPNAAITETANGSVTARTLAGTVGAITLGGVNSVDQLGPLSVTGALILKNAGPLALVGNLSGGSVALTLGGALTQSGGIVTADQLSLQATTATLSGANRIKTFGPSTLSGSGVALTLNDAQDLTLAGLTATAGSASITAAGNIALTGSVDLGAHTLTLVSTSGRITQAANATITAGTLTGSAARVTLVSDNRIDALGPFSSPSGSFSTGPAFQLTTVGTLTVAGTLDIRTGGIALTSNTGDIAIRASVESGGDVQLTTPGAVIQTAGTLSAPSGTIVIDAASASLTQAGNTVAAIAGNTTGDLTLANQGELKIGNLSVGGTFTVTAGALSQSGTLSAAILTGSTTGSTVLGGAQRAAIGTLGDFSAGTNFTLVDAIALTTTGTLSGPKVGLTVPQSLTLDGGRLTGNAINILATEPGATITQRGVTQVLPGTARPSTLAITFAGSGGQLTLAELDAANMNVTLNLGTGGTASGLLNAGQLRVVGGGGSAKLTGSVGGVSDGTAATRATASAIDTNYTFNDCTIAAITCGAVAPAIAVELTTPRSFLETTLGSILRTNLFTADLITIGILRSPTDPDLLLPNISDRDY